MTMRLQVVHRTEYRYESPVTYSYNEARLTPQTTATQTVLGSALRTDPNTTTLRYWDYLGTQVTAFDLHRPHSALEVVATSTVETDEEITGLIGSGTTDPGDNPGTGWEVLQDQRFRDLHSEFLSDTQYTAFEPSMATAAADVADQPDPAAAVHRAGELVRDHLTYRTGATGVRTTAAQAWEARSGVCQDFAHITIALLRRAGIPARYVSGYLHPKVTPEVGTTVVGESHAWVEGWVGDWLAVDPTNGSPVSKRHVLVGRARDYRDVSPFRGIYAGAGGSTLEVSVEITRLR
jgi:transglutaminase-like putative cysteine protease